MCVLGTLNVIAFDKQIYIHVYLKYKSSVISERLKSKIPTQNGCQKKFQSICQNKNNPTKFNVASKKLIKPSPNIIVTWKITIPF